MVGFLVGAVGTVVGAAVAVASAGASVVPGAAGAAVGTGAGAALVLDAVAVRPQSMAPPTDAAADSGASFASVRRYVASAAETPVAMVTALTVVARQMVLKNARAVR